jgi:hypothetical protein
VEKLQLRPMFPDKLLIKTYVALCKVEAGYVVYNFYIGRFCSLVQLFIV